VVTGSQFKTYTQTSAANTEFLAFSENRIVGLTPPGRASQIYVWDIKIGSIVKHLDLPGTLFNEVQISTNGRLVLATPYDRFLYGFDFNRAKSVEFRPEQQLGKIKNFSISPDGHHVAIAVGSWLYIWEPESGSILAKLDIKPDRLLRWSHIVGQFSGLSKVYSVV
jgi:WD40 repeat protein